MLRPFPWNSKIVRTVGVSSNLWKPQKKLVFSIKLHIRVVAKTSKARLSTLWYNLRPLLYQLRSPGVVGVTTALKTVGLATMF